MSEGFTGALIDVFVHSYKVAFTTFSVEYKVLIKAANSLMMNAYLFTFSFSLLQCIWCWPSIIMINFIYSWELCKKKKVIHVTFLCSLVVQNLTFLWKHHLDPIFAWENCSIIIGKMCKSHIFISSISFHLWSFHEEIHQAFPIGCYICYN